MVKVHSHQFYPVNELFITFYCMKSLEMKCIQDLYTRNMLELSCRNGLLRFMLQMSWLLAVTCHDIKNVLVSFHPLGLLSVLLPVS